VWLFAHLGDAVYARLAAAQRVTARSGDAAATQNAVLLDVATAYLELAGAEARLAVLRRGEDEVGEVARRTAEFARAGQGRKADADRAAANADLVRRDIHRAEEDVAVAAARLARLLNLDPALGLRTFGGEVGPIELVPGNDLEALLAMALAARPELLARSAAVQEARTRGRAERVRPWLPTVSVGFSSGVFGGGGGQAPSDFGQFGGRTDFDVLAAWNVQNLGFGNRARVRGADAAVGSALAAYDVALNQVRREVAEALAASQAAARQVTVARDALAVAEEGFRLEADRIRQGQGLPIETLDSFRQLLDARQEVVRAVVAYDVAQFRLYAATGAGCGTGWRESR
jgi:outer membrane protein TolC